MWNLSGIAVEGQSTGGLGTCILLPGYDLVLDIGICPRSAIPYSTVFISHAHMDHLGALAQHCATRSLMAMDPPTYLVPAEIEPDLKDMLASWRRLDGSNLPCRIVPLRPGDQHPLGPSTALLVLRSLHRPPCIGCAVVSFKNKLKAEYAGLDGTRIRDLRLAGVPVTERVLSSDVAYPGDTLIDVLEIEPLYAQARLLILETTFLDERVSVEACRGKGHVHLDEVIERAELLVNRSILLTHFSARYTDLEVHELIRQRLPRELGRRVTVMLSSTYGDSVGISQPSQL